MIRYGIVHKTGGLYSFITANQGHYHYDSRARGEEVMEIFRPQLESKLGQTGHMVTGIECWSTGDSQRSIFGTEIEDPELQKLMDEAHELEANRPKLAGNPGGYYSSKRYEARVKAVYLEIAKFIDAADT